jgi:hypothetical protein
VALRHGICPYYLGQELLRWADVLVGDVNHQFDSKGMLWGLMRALDWKLAVLVDEAHNLVDRARRMYSAGLRIGQVRAAAQTAPCRDTSTGIRCSSAFLAEHQTVRVADGISTRYAHRERSLERPVAVIARSGGRRGGWATQSGRISSRASGRRAGASDLQCWVECLPKASTCRAHC